MVQTRPNLAPATTYLWRALPCCNQALCPTGQTTTYCEWHTQGFSCPTRQQHFPRIKVLGQFSWPSLPNFPRTKRRVSHARVRKQTARVSHARVCFESSWNQNLVDAPVCKVCSRTIIGYRYNSFEGVRQ